MSEIQKHTGGCHCGKVRYEVATDLGRVMQCNCSICSKRGWLLTFVPAEQFKLVAGDEAQLTDYQFGKKRIHHKFCPTCGVASFSLGAKPDGQKMYAVNVRCLDEVDVTGLTITQVDGKSL